MFIRVFRLVYTCVMSLNSSVEENIIYFNKYLHVYVDIFIVLMVVVIEAG